MKRPETCLMMNNLLTHLESQKSKEKKLKMHLKNKNTSKKCSTESENILTLLHKESQTFTLLYLTWPWLNQPTSGALNSISTFLTDLLKK